MTHCRELSYLQVGMVCWMNVNGRMRPVKSILGKWGRGIKKNDGEVNSSICLIQCKKFYKCHNVPPPAQQ
jgi:hypothetical protein